MVKVKSQSTIDIPEGVTVSVKNRIVSVTGPRGNLTKDLRHLKLDFRVDNVKRTLSVICWFGSKLPIAQINTAIKLVKNMIVGVTKGFLFKIRCAYAHFPINVSVDGQTIEVRNFLGEKRVRRQVLPASVKITQTDPSKVKDEIILEGNDLEQVSREAAVLHQMCLVRNKDIRKFLDGIYVQTKTTVVVDED